MICSAASLLFFTRKAYSGSQRLQLYTCREQTLVILRDLASGGFLHPSHVPQMWYRMSLGGWTTTDLCGGLGWRATRSTRASAETWRTRKCLLFTFLAQDMSRNSKQAFEGGLPLTNSEPTGWLKRERTWEGGSTLKTPRRGRRAKEARGDETFLQLAMHARTCKSIIGSSHDHGRERSRRSKMRSAEVAINRRWSPPTTVVGAHDDDHGREEFSRRPTTSRNWSC